MKTPRDYQKIAIERACRKPLLLGDKCGLGKTLVGVEAAKACIAQLGKPALIVVPSGIVKRQWYDALIEQGISADRIIWLDSDNFEDFKQLATDTIVLTHYEALRKHVNQYLMIGTYWSLIIADEAHRIKNRKAKRSEALKQLKSYRRLALTGTPYDKDPSDIWSILNWLDPNFFTSYWRFYNAHINYKEVEVKRGVRIKQIDPRQSLKDPENFARVLRPYMLQRSKEDVRDDLPSLIQQYIDLDMYPEQARAYAQLVAAEDPIVTIDGTDITVQIALTQMLREVQMTTEPMLLGLEIDSVKIDWVLDWLHDNPNESVIIFTRFRDTAIKLHRALGEKFELIIGGKDKPHIDASKRYLVGTIAAMGEGLDLPHIDYAIFIDAEFSSILMQQAMDRIHRINITNAKQLMYLRCVGTTDMLVHQMLSNKWNTKQLVEAWLAGKHQNAINPI